MSGPRVLVVDDEPQIRRALRAGLTHHGYQVQLAATGEEALDLAATAPLDAVILDLMLPDTNGLDVCRELRRWTGVPIVILSARGQERDKVEALDLGADDYLTKPFGMAELLARLRAALRRVARVESAPVLECEALRLDRAARLVTHAGRRVHLTPTEYDLLCYLMEHPGKVVTHRALLQAVWGPGHEDGHRMLRVFIAQLRRKIEPDPARPTYVGTEPGVGYRFRLGA